MTTEPVVLDELVVVGYSEKDDKNEDIFQWWKICLNL